MRTRKVRIWEIYFLKEIFKIFFLFLFSFFFVYALIDYSVHMQDFLRDKKLQIKDLTLYYGYQFIKRSSLLLPLALLVSTIKVLTNFTTHREFMALQVAGLSFKRLMRPFFLAGSLCVLFNFFSMEFLAPRSLRFLDEFYYDHLKNPHSKNKRSGVQSLTLKDESKLIYQSYDSERGQYFDCIWIKSPNEMWKMKYLESSGKVPIGKYMDRLVRAPDGSFEKRESFEEKAFPEMHLQKTYVGRRGQLPLENRSLSELFQMGFQKKSHSYMKMEILSQFYYKCTLPFLSLLAVIAPAPFCIHMRRGSPLFFLYSIALFGFVALFALMDAALIIGENRLLYPSVAILLPFTLVGLPLFWNFARTK